MSKILRDHFSDQFTPVPNTPVAHPYPWTVPQLPLQRVSVEIRSSRVMFGSEPKKVDVAARAKAERLERERRRKEANDEAVRTKHVLTLQRFFRRMLAKRRATLLIREMWDGWMAEGAPGSADALLLVWIFFRFWKPGDDDDRLASLCKKLLIDAPNKSSWLTFFTHKDVFFRRFSVRSMATLMHACLDRACGKTDRTTTKASLASAFASGPELYLSGAELRFLITYANWKAYGPACHTALGEIASIMTTDDTYRIIKSGLFSRMKLFYETSGRKRMDSQDAKLLKSIRIWTHGIVHYALFPVGGSTAKVETPLKSTPVVDLALQNFTVELLTVPAWISYAEAQCVSLLTQSGIVKYLFGPNMKFYISLEGESALFMLGNMVDIYLASKKATDIDPVSFTAFAPRVCEILAHCKTYVSETATNLTKLHPIFEWYSGRTTNLPSEVTKTVTAQVSYLWTRPFISNAFHHVQQDPAETVSSDRGGKPGSKRAENTLAVIEIRDACDLFMNLITTLLNQRQRILNTVTYMPKLIPNLWRMIQTLGPDGGVAVFLSAAKNPSKEHCMPMLSLFCICARLLFLTLDDEEIYEKQAPFKPDELADITHFLNRYCFYLVWNNVVPVTASSTVVSANSPLIGAPMKLLTLLADRHSRRPFVEKPDNWLVVPQASQQSFVKSFNENDPRAVFIVNYLPQSVPFRTRVAIFRGIVQHDKQTLGSYVTPIKVHRTMVLEDGFRQLSGLSPLQFKHPVRVKFISKLGLEEIGIDQSGVFKEFLEDLCKQVFAQNLNLFSTTEDGYLYPSPTAFVSTENHLDLLEFVGKVLGKALYEFLFVLEGIVIDMPFALFIYTKLLGKYNMLDELPSLDPQLYKNLMFLKHYDGDCEDLGLNFTIDRDHFGAIVTKEIKPGGRVISVGNENKHEYCYLMADFRLNQETKDEYRAFVGGFKSIISDEWTRMFSSTELQKMMCGEGTFDLSDLRKYTKYEGGYFDHHPTIKNLWKVLGEMDLNEKREFLKFVTSCSKPPVGGFEHLTPPLTIRFVPADPSDEGDAPTVSGIMQSLGSVFGVGIKDAQRLPTAATCFNLLKLPAYTKRNTLKQKLLYSVFSIMM
ncbi:hypothetical protein BJ742DRAFT_743736 [Cladochytrium replicatum]|nr:hypothetical protein BJ742DRAFT_743736 [Cladochytrium replicatum]